MAAELDSLDIEGIIERLGTVEDVNKQTDGCRSMYELAYARSCSIICQMTADKFQPTQKLLIKHLFGESQIKSVFASDLYMFIVRLLPPNSRTAMYKLIENLSKLAPSRSSTVGMALINRISSAQLS